MNDEEEILFMLFDIRLSYCILQLPLSQDHTDNQFQLPCSKADYDVVSNGESSCDFSITDN